MLEAPVQRRRVGLWLLQASPVVSFATLVTTVALSSPWFSARASGFWLAVVLCFIAVLLMVPKSVGWLLVASDDPHMPDPVRDAAKQARHIHACHLVALGVTISTVLAQARLLFMGFVFGIISVVGALCLLLTLLMRYNIGSRFIYALSEALADEPLQRRQWRYASCLLGLGPFIAMLLVFQIAKPAVGSGVILLVMAGVLSREGWVFSGMLSRRLRAGFGTACGACGYDVRGLDSPVCPECGAPVSGGLAPNH